MYYVSNCYKRRKINKRTTMIKKNYDIPIRLVRAKACAMKLYKVLLNSNKKG